MHKDPDSCATEKGSLEQCVVDWADVRWWETTEAGMAIGPRCHEGYKGMTSFALQEDAQVQADLPNQELHARGSFQEPGGERPSHR